MGLIKYVCSKFSCTSNCSFNNELFDVDLQKISLENFKLKHKDLMTIHKILNKREKIELSNWKNTTEI